VIRKIAPLAFGLWLCACAGASPLMYPAHPLSDGNVRFAAGAAANFALGTPSHAIDEAAAEPVGVMADRPTEKTIRGALAVAAMAPGVSPLVSGRVGLGYDMEGGLTYTGRAAHLDARWAWVADSLALSFGAGASALLSRRGASPDMPIAGLDLDATTGWGVDVPIVFGWHSDADMVWWWTGTRGGYERLRGDVGYRGPAPALPIDGEIDGYRAHLSQVMGFAIGFRYLHAAVEVQGGYAWASGTLWETDVSVQGLTFSPAASLIGHF